ncbi:hypothetical protein SAM23877_3218 [Streptomyces ambofaciens ATCC 23877]|uniref:Uncharacterized protein n=1 Tax=Streptomyces ambofaciens (strain ATCC 23877 / 3486 / DSM 40053 / JCM 4204 / NBRC 12836 / NRRL B-2516) TaxID=278992 RepID=A0A0K2ATW3_STRA7|nr:hypothetical protein SAM23877_3218 [Streptomyces ambofaciens ATCC 23877]
MIDMRTVTAHVNLIERPADPVGPDQHRSEPTWV